MAYPCFALDTEGGGWILICSSRAVLSCSSVIFFSSRMRRRTTKLRWRAQNAFAVRQARQAVETLWSCYGANAIYTRDPLQRFLRDVQAIGQHFSFNFDIAGAAFGTVALGGKYTNPTM